MNYGINFEIILFKIENGKLTRIKKLIHYKSKTIIRISKINCRNSIRLGNALPINRPRPPPSLFINVNKSVLRIKN